MPCVWCLVPGSYQTTRRQRPLTAPIHDRSIAENSINLILSRHLFHFQVASFSMSCYSFLKSSARYKIEEVRKPDNLSIRRRTRSMQSVKNKRRFQRFIVTRDVEVYLQTVHANVNLAGRLVNVSYPFVGLRLACSQEIPPDSRVRLEFVSNRTKLFQYSD